MYVYAIPFMYVYAIPSMCVYAIDRRIRGAWYSFPSLLLGPNAFRVLPTTE